MGKRVRRGGRSPSSSSAVLDRDVLRRRIVSSKLDSSFDVGAVVNHLRSNYPDYARIKVQPFTLRVQKTLEFLHQTLESSSGDSEDATGDGTPGPLRKKPSKGDESEQRLLRAEAEHLRNQKRKIQNPATSDASTSASTSTSDDDAIFEAKVDPEFDLMKSMLRANYGKKSSEKPAGREDDNMEIEMANEKKRAIVGSKPPRGEASARKERALPKGEAVERETTRFKDLGGMKNVLEELTMEVIVPLLHPELPMRLGVRPITGILLQGPPGCGKTRLAQAIANETGVPFYPKSATEFVTAVSGKLTCMHFRLLVSSQRRSTDAAIVKGIKSLCLLILYGDDCDALNCLKLACSAGPNFHSNHKTYLYII